MTLKHVKNKTKQNYSPIKQVQHCIFKYIWKIFDELLNIKVQVNVNIFQSIKVIQIKIC